MPTASSSSPPELAMLANTRHTHATAAPTAPVAQGAVQQDDTHKLHRQVGLLYMYICGIYSRSFLLHVHLQTACAFVLQQNVGDMI